MKSYISQFNEHLLSFINDLQYLNIKNIKNMNYYLKINHKIGINIFRQYILYNEINRIMIFEQNESFFLSQQYVENDNGTISQIISELKKEWCQLDEENKQKIWDYFKVFIYFSDKDLDIDTSNYNKQIKQNYSRCVDI